MTVLRKAIRIFLIVVSIILIDTQLRYLFDYYDFFNLVQGTFSSLHENHLANTASQLLLQLIFFGWAYLLIVYSIVKLSFSFGSNINIKRTILSVFLFLTGFSLYWLFAQRGLIQELYYGLSLYLILGLITPSLISLFETLFRVNEK